MLVQSIILFVFVAFFFQFIQLYLKFAIIIGVIYFLVFKL